MAASSLCLVLFSQTFDLQHKVWSSSQSIMAKNSNLRLLCIHTTKHTYFSLPFRVFISNRLYHNNRSAWKYMNSNIGVGVSANAFPPWWTDECLCVLTSWICIAVRQWMSFWLRIRLACVWFLVLTMLHNNMVASLKILYASKWMQILVVI